MYTTCGVQFNLKKNYSLLNTPICKVKESYYTKLYSSTVFDANISFGANGFKDRNT